MEQPTINEILRVLTELKFKVFSNPYDVNLGAIRTKDNAANTFNDWLFAFCFDEDEGIIFEVVPGTTDAGLFYRLNPLNVDGTAIIKHDVQHLGAYQLQDPKKDPTKRGHRGQKAFKQVALMKYWRDANRDKYLDFDGEEVTGIFATNGHYMGTKGRQVDKWSAGCWGATVNNLNKIFKVAELQIKHGYGDKFTFSLLHENNF